MWNIKGSTQNASCRLVWAPALGGNLIWWRQQIPVFFFLSSRSFQSCRGLAPMCIWKFSSLFSFLTTFCESKAIRSDGPACVSIGAGCCAASEAEERVRSWSRYLEAPPGLKINTPSSGCTAAVCRSRRPRRTARHSHSLCNWSPFSATQVNVGEVKPGATSRGTTPALHSSLPSVHSHMHGLTPGRDYADAVEGRMYARWKSRYGASVTAVVKWWRWMLNMFSTFASRARAQVQLFWKTQKHFFIFSFFPSLLLPAAFFLFFFNLHQWSV